MSLLLTRAILWAAVMLVLAAAAGIDLKRRIIPNESVVLIAAGGVALSLLSRPGSTLLSLLICAVVLLALLVFSHLNVLGAGDAKLIAATTLLVPPDRTGLLLLAIALAGGLLSGIYLAAFHGLKYVRAVRHHGVQRSSRHPTGSFAQFRRAGYARMRLGYSLPYALAILAGVGFYLASEIYQCSSGISCSL
jgi:prepilin peptidase CpaA